MRLPAPRNLNLYPIIQNREDTIINWRTTISSERSVNVMDFNQTEKISSELKEEKNNTPTTCCAPAKKTTFEIALLLLNFYVLTKQKIHLYQSKSKRIWCICKWKNVLFVVLITLCHRILKFSRKRKCWIKQNNIRKQKVKNHLPTVRTRVLE